MGNFIVNAVRRWDAGFVETGYISHAGADKTLLVVTPAFTPGDAFHLCLPPKATIGYEVVLSDANRTVLVVGTHRHYTEGGKRSRFALPGPTEEQLANFIAMRLNDPSQIEPL